MRIKVHLRGSGILPFDYHYHLGSALYHYMKLANEELSTQLHYSRRIKEYTFSEIMVPKRKIHKGKGIEILDGYAYIIFTSPCKDYVEAVVTGLLDEPQLRVDNINFLIEQVEVLPSVNTIWNTVHFKTLSPIVVTRRNAQRKKEPVKPTDKDWYIILENNIKHGYEEFYGTRPGGRISIEPVNKIGLKTNKYEFPKEKGGAIHAVRGHFIFRGPPELIKFAYEAGVGERGAWGFGCLEVVNERKVKRSQRSGVSKAFIRRYTLSAF